MPILNNILSFESNLLGTNSYLYKINEKNILFDAPLGSYDWIISKKLTIDKLILTHAHYDHIIDVNKIKEHFGCKIVAHSLSQQMAKENDFFKNYGIDVEIEPFKIDILVENVKEIEIYKQKIQTIYVPGHSPDSICYYLEEDKILIGGDVIFRNSIGRFDLPGGDGKLLIKGIKEKLINILPDNTIVLPGHGEHTTIGFEKENNPYLASGNGMQNFFLKDF